MSNDAPPVEPSATPLLVVISGPSGVGKDSVLDRLRERGVPAHYTTTTTTRPRRENDDPRLTFLTDAEFDRLLAEDGLLEHATVYGHRYGVPKAQVRDALARGQDVIMRVDVQGAATIKRLVPNAVLIFLAPPSMAELEARLRERRRDEPDTIDRRLQEAERELARQAEFDHVIVNQSDALDAAVDQVLAIMGAERSRAGRRPVEI